MTSPNVLNNPKIELFDQALRFAWAVKARSQDNQESLCSGLTLTANHWATSHSSQTDSVIQFREINLPQTLSPQDKGEAKVVVTQDKINLTFNSINLYASTDNKLDSNDELVGTLPSQSFTLQPNQAQSFTLQFSNPTRVAIGAYNLIASVDNNSVAESNDRSVSQRVSAFGSDAIIQWNATTLNAIRTDSTSPPEASRALAIVHAAMYDAVNSIEQVYSPYFVQINPALVQAASAEAAASAAAYIVLRSLYPDQTSTFNEQLVLSLASIPIDAAAGIGLALGGFVASEILAWRSTDESTTIVPYTPETTAGSWQPTLPNFTPALLPQWADITPFAMTSDSQFRSSGPPALDSARYAADFNQAKELGRSDSTTRTSDQTEIARFWADGAGTFTPPGHWNEIAERIAVHEDDTLLENARLFALLNISLADAAIVAWDAKYNYNFWRPITAIQHADRDNNPLTSADLTWTPLLNTPPFPEYISGHSTFSGAASTVLTDFFGEHYAFSDSTINLPNVTRQYSSFAAAADEAGASRIYGGIHFSSANEDGLASGRALAHYVDANFLTELKSVNSIRKTA